MTFFWTLVNDIMHGEDMKGDKCCSTYREKESLSSTGLEELLPLVRIPHREGDGVDAVLELGWDGARPLVQLEAKQHITIYTEEGSNEFLKAWVRNRATINNIILTANISLSVLSRTYHKNVYPLKQWSHVLWCCVFARNTCTHQLLPD